MKYLNLCLWLLCSLASTPLLAGSEPIPILDYGDPKATALWQAFEQLQKGERQEPLRIMQLGDSHTGGDYFSGQLRTRLQQAYGNAGIGWLTPGYITNQRSHQVLLRGKGSWKLSDAKINKHTGIFPLGGFINTSAGNSILEIKAKEPPAAGQWRIGIWQQPRPTPWTLALPGGKLHKLSVQASSASAWRLSTQELAAANVDGLRLLAPAGG
ncbi:MAG TPA: hypothetical protein VLC79_08425, partial [Cellvibrio sp.]|nr:hypothetical protein [Cellvibrio sp.]